MLNGLITGKPPAPFEPVGSVTMNLTPFMDREDHWAQLICGTVAKTPEGLAAQFQYFIRDLAPMYLSEMDGLIDAFNRIAEKLPFANAGAAPSMGGAA